ncbi:MAG: YhdH/YhfP family quinone oxidoreductase [Pirellulaceae bacterium]
MASTFRCLYVQEDASGNVSHGLADRPLDDLPIVDGPACQIDVRWTALNYKDALAATGHRGVIRSLPHIPGIDAVGTIASSDSAQFSVGDQVIVTGYDLGTSRFGAWAEKIRVPVEWVVPLPEGLSQQEAIILGTAGFTAAQCVAALLHNRVAVDEQPIVVTGATGGVAGLSIQILAKLGFHVVAVTGKQDEHDRLKSWGASEVISRNDFTDTSGRPMLSARFSGAIDTVGGSTLETVLRQIAYRGCVAACGLAGGHELHTTVYPFLLRGITLAGIDSAMCPMSLRRDIWRKLAGDWKPQHLNEIAHQIRFDELPEAVASMLSGKHIGRSIVALESP